MDMIDYIVLGLLALLVIILFILTNPSITYLVSCIISTWAMPRQLKQWRLAKQTKKARKPSLLRLINLTQGK